MTINRANQTWPKEVTTTTYSCDLHDDHTSLETTKECMRLRKIADAGPEPEDEFERRQRGSAGTIAVAVILALFVTFAVAVMPLIQHIEVR